MVDFPLFLRDEQGKLESAHHPFTSPKLDQISLVREKPLEVTGEHFDLVLCGEEIGGGSLRIHDAGLQEYVLREVLQEDVSEMKYFMEALRFGCPPHGGIALGVDRLLALICDANSIRDVMAFPKSSQGNDLMSGAPSSISAHVKRLYDIK